jgi:peptidoglycan/xylan/chitin deacetylase (PgdA/CDA1 family)
VLFLDRIAEAHLLPILSARSSERTLSPVHAMMKFIAAFLASILLAVQVHAAVGDTTVAKWQNDAKAVFLLMFDDSWPSHFEVAVPELVKRDMIATFYICPGKGEYKVFKDKWEKEIWKTGMVYGNHTFTHGGVRDLDHAKEEIGKANDAIYDMVPGKKPRLISYAQPGVAPGKWNITGDELKALLKENNLVDRGDFKGHGAVYHWKTAEEMLALADKAIAASDMEYLVIHGVERRAPLNTTYQDFWALNQDVLRAVLDGLKERRDRGDLWITDHISYHQYLTERQTAKVAATESTATKITLKLTSDADAALYDQPLTLVTTVPAMWTSVQVAQGDKKQTLTAKDGVVKFPAVPGPAPIELTPAKP